MVEKFLRTSEAFSGERVFNDIVEISRFHRIQGSRGLVEAVEYVKGKLEEIGISYRLFNEKYDGKSWYLTLKSPIAWDLEWAEIEVKEKNIRITSERTPLVAMAHSPSGEVEGEVLPILREEDWERAAGKIVLVGKDWRKAYKKANEAGAKGFLAYRKDTGNAFPYIGLFLTKDDLEWAKIPAGAVSESIATKLIESAGSSPKVRLSIQATIKDHERLPILYAEIGEPPFIGFSAHVCHPKPGANDNASGSAMLIELVRILSELWNKEFRFGFSFLWVPEYYGTQAFMERYANVEDYYTVFNLDMVGGSEDRSGSTLMLVRPPLSRFSLVTGVLEYFIDLTNRGNVKSFSGSSLPVLKFKPHAYELGSDHDVFNFFGIPSAMPITWPDRFYHTSEDTPEKVSVDSLQIVGRAVLSSALFLATAGKDDLKRFARGYAMRYLGEISMNRETENAEKLVMNGLFRDGTVLEIETGHKLEGQPWLKWSVRGRISEEYVEKKDPSVAENLERLTKNRMNLVYLHELIMLGEILPERDAYKALEEEFGAVKKEQLKELGKAIELLEGIGVIERLYG